MRKDFRGKGFPKSSQIHQNPLDNIFCPAKIQSVLPTTKQYPSKIIGPFWREMISDIQKTVMPIVPQNFVSGGINRWEARPYRSLFSERGERGSESEELFIRSPFLRERPPRTFSLSHPDRVWEWLSRAFSFRNCSKG